MPPRILTIGRHRLACEAARALLGDTRATFLDHLPTPPDDWRDLEPLKADLLLIESDTPEATLAAVLESYQGPLPWQVVVFSIRDNRLHLYHYEQRALRNGQDLLQALQDLTS